MKSGSPNWKLGPNAALKELHLLPSAHGPDFDEALKGEAIARARRCVEGIRRYQKHPTHRSSREAPILWQKGTTCLRDYKPGADDKPILFVIPSLINRFDILDLDRSNSFLRRAAEEGFRPLVIDWGMPGADEQNFTLDDYVQQRLLPAFDWVIEGEAFSIKPAKINILGYCMGGLLSLALAQLRLPRTRSLSLLATPWDFHQPDPEQGRLFSSLIDQIMPSLDTLGYLPVDIIQGLFALMQPMQVIAKFSDFAGLDPGSEEARHFVLLEDWLNDGVPLVTPTARECLIGWYGENTPARGQWKIAGQVIDPRLMTAQTYLIVPGLDKIVPPEQALPLVKLLPHASLHEPMTGHIGMITSSRAPTVVWSPYFRWLKEHA